LTFSANYLHKTLPKLIIIDFDCTLRSASKPDYLWSCNEIECLCELRNECNLDIETYHHKRGGHPDDWLGFKKIPYWKNGGRPQVMALMLEIFRDLAKKSRDKMATARVKNLKDLMELAGHEIT
jgi:hypothetical protein